MKVRLTRLGFGALQRRIRLKHLPVVLGRSVDADVHLDDQWASRCHCEISEANGTLVVRDLGSRNGTLVNGQYVQEARLNPGDRLTIGLNTFEVWYKRRADTPISAVAVGQA